MNRSNRSEGNRFESDLCDLLFEYGFWVHNLHQGKEGQPADIIACREERSYLIDAKVCNGKRFDLSRVEPNQLSAMTLWGERTAFSSWFAIRIEGQIFFLSNYLIRQFMLDGRASISVADMNEYGYTLTDWVNRFGGKEDEC